MTTAGARRSRASLSGRWRSRHSATPSVRGSAGRSASIRSARSRARTSLSPHRILLTQFARIVSIDADRYRSADHSPEKNRDAEQARTLRGQVRLLAAELSRLGFVSQGSVVVRETRAASRAAAARRPTTAARPTTSGASSEGQDVSRRLTRTRPSSTIVDRQPATPRGDRR